jgi:hypothetical protein
MRLGEIKKDLEEAYTNINFKEVNPNSNPMQLKGAPSSFEAIHKIEKYGIFERELSQLKGMPTIYGYRSIDDTISLSSSQVGTVEALLNSVKEKIKSNLSLIEFSIPKQTDKVINVKLPTYTDISQLTAFFKNLDIALHTGLKIKEVNGEYKLNNFESGSLWIGVLIEIGLERLSKLINAAMDSYKKSIEIRTALEVLKRNKIATKMYEELENDLTEQVHVLTKQTCEHLIENFDAESQANTLKSVETLMSLIIQGTRFKAPDAASEEVKNIFPKDEEYEKLPKPQSLLETKEQGQDKSDK